MIIDISQEVLSCKVFPGDPAPSVERLNSMKKGDLYNLTAFSMCAHNGTHVDAPAHFIEDGKTIDEIGLDAFVGDCYVTRFKGDVITEDAIRIMKEAEAIGAEKRILIAGEVTIMAEAAK